MQAIILAAGMGKRLKELTRDNTKCMLKVNGVRLIERMLSQLASLNLTRCILVIGYKGDGLRAFVGEKWQGLQIEYIENPIFNKTNNIYSLALASDEMCKDDTLLMESDIIFEDSILEKVINDSHPNVACVDAFQSWMDGTCVTIDENNLIKRFVPKKDFVYEEIPSYYKTVNIYKFSKDFSRKEYVPFLKAYSEALGLNEYYEQVLRVITMLDKPLMYALPLSGDKWYEIDDIQDLDIAESIFCSLDEQKHKLGSRYGGYWRYPMLKDYCYLVTPYFPSSRLKAEIKNSFDILLESYPSGQRVNALLAAKTFGVNIDEIVVGNGASELIKAYMGLLDGKVGFIYPTFEEYPNRVDAKQRVVFTPSAANGFRYAARDLIRHFSTNPVSSLILVNPDNPSGNFLDKREIDQIVAWTESANINLLVDESFCDFSDSPFSLLQSEFLEAHPTVSVMKSISKSYGVPGLRLGVLASGSSSLIDSLRKNVSIWNINSFAEFFLQICEKYADEYRQGCRRMAEERKRFIERLGRVNYLEVFQSQANFVLCRVKPTHTVAELMERLLVKNILIKDCSEKNGFMGAPFIRLAIKDMSDNDYLISALEEF